MRKTIVYIDAFNLYYGALRDSNCRWLDLGLMVKNILPKNEIIEIKYFYAPLKNNPEKYLKQRLYINALKKHQSNFKGIKGYFVEKEKVVKNLNPPPPKVITLIREEKGTDVNIAVEIVKDSFVKNFDVIVLVSNDGDLARSLQVAKENGKKTIVISPVKKERMKHYSKSLKNIADFHFSHISKSILQKSILPNPVGKFFCPEGWK